jgi:peptidoglycan/LPS O-acetylase OafA/YrhL
MLFARLRASLDDARVSGTDGERVTERVDVEAPADVEAPPAADPADAEAPADVAAPAPEPLDAEAPASEPSRRRFLPSGLEAGTAPDDRKFRPDVEGLRAVAVLLVVLYHAGIRPFTGGYVGVDVFFVISGFVITGLLLRERAVTGRTSVLSFYARRCRRILPAAALVVVATLWATYHWLGFIRGEQVVADARAAALFVANFHFISLQTNYLTAQRPPSPLQNLWSLSVEEQFYLVYPTFFILLGALATASRRIAFRTVLAVGLSLVIAASLAWSIHQTATNATAAYFSPLTHAWELALGALVAVGTAVLASLPKPVAAALTWGGVAAILVAATAYSDATSYPGIAVALPVVGTACVIAGGTPIPRFGAEFVLRQRVMQWFGKLSYSLYLWHWPLLAIAAEHAGHELSTASALGWVVVAVALSVVTYTLVENPIRRGRRLSRRPLASIALGGLLTAAVLSVTTLELHAH